MQSTMLGLERRSTSLLGRLRSMFGNSEHLWMLDYLSMRDELEAAGCINVRQAAFDDSQDPMFKRVEEADRFEKGGIVEWAIETFKPG